MELPPKALFALIDIRKDLLSREPIVREEPPVPIAPPKKENKRPRTFEGHHARASNAFQRGCQRRAPWTPVH